MFSEEKNLLSQKGPMSTGLGLVTATIILSGEMAGSGVLALPSAMVGTGWSGLILIAFFAINGAYIGSRLGLCWEILSEMFDEFNEPHVRDPYPLIAEKAGLAIGYRTSKILRRISIGCIIATLYGSGCVFIVLISSFLHDLTQVLNPCVWMVIVTVVLTPMTWLGSPKDFWPIAVLALLTTITACLLTMVQLRIDLNDNNTFCPSFNKTNHTHFEPDFPEPTAGGYFKAFASIMFAFGGASTFPTVQADMKDKKSFKWAAIISLGFLFAIYTPVASVGYATLGNCVNGNMIFSLSDGPVRKAAEAVLLLHLVSVLPIVINPPSQYFEEIMGIPKNINWKRIVFRTSTMLILLFIAESVPNFGSILDLVGGSSVTLLTFVFPPMLYVFCSDLAGSERLSTLERVYCWFLVFVGVAGGITATVTAIINIASNSFQPPCYVTPLAT